MKELMILFGFLLSASSVRAMSDSLVVYVFLLEKCQICSVSMPEIKKLYFEYHDQGVEFRGIFPNLSISDEIGIDSFVKVHELPFTIQRDEGQELTARLEATVTPEAILMNTRNGQILYRGKLDNMYERVGKRRQVVTEFYLADALKSAIINEEIAINHTDPIGCFIMKHTPNE